MVKSDFKVDQTLPRVKLRSATTMHGAQCVMMRGELLMLLWPVDNWDFLNQVFAGIECIHQCLQTYF